MATVEQHATGDADERRADVTPRISREIPVENPATGEIVAHRPRPRTPTQSPRWPRAAARPSRSGRRYGFDGRGRGAAARAEVGDGQRRAGHRDDRLRDRQDLRGRRARRDRLRRQRVRLLGASRRPATSPTSASSPASCCVKGKKLLLRYRPLGLIGVIGPWNYPLTNSFGDCIPALVAGNSVILKPSEITPLTSLLMAEGLRECGLPEDVLQIATGRGATGAALIEQVDMIMFTGSTRDRAQGRRGGRQPADPRSLELGGKDPDDRARRRRPRARGQLRDLLLDAERRPDAASRSSASTSRSRVYDEFVAKVDREGARAARRPARQARARSRSARSPSRPSSR